MTFRWRTLLSISLLVLLLLTGCSQDPQQGLPGGAAPAVLELWHSLKGAEAEVLGEQVEYIMGAYPEVIINLEYVPENDMVEKTFLAQAGGAGPELFLTSGEILRELFHKGALGPLAGTGDSFVNITSQFTYGEKTYAIPLALDVPLFYYRTDLAQIPTNLGDFLTTNGVLALNKLDTKSLAPWWLAQGGKLTNNGQPTLDHGENLIFIYQLLLWQEENILLIAPNSWELFVNGEVAYTIAPASRAKSLNPEIPWGSMPLTQLTNQQGYLLGERIIGIANSSIKTTESLSPWIRLVEEEILDPEFQGTLAEAGNRFPASSSFYSGEEGQKGILIQVGQSLAQVWSLPGNALEWRLIPIQDQAWQAIGNGALPEDSLAQGQQKAKELK
ncbi:MAG: extracellular solute-binding protein [Desulfitobacterium sp.]|nr:extracellular solute-binding protein [Desulfitobacterium sp.]